MKYRPERGSFKPMRSRLSSTSKILWEAYDQFLLPLGGKKVPTPYRRNEVGSLQKLGPEFQGKSSPEVLTQTTKKLAKEQNFDLNSASAEEIREFMRQNKLGIDCSGFVYRMLNHLVQNIKGKSLEGFGFPHVGRTNVDKLSSDEFSIKISDFDQVQPGDLIRLNSGEKFLHCVIILEKDNHVITYAHSSEDSSVHGVHTGQIKNRKLPEDLMTAFYNPLRGDGIRRLKILS